MTVESQVAGLANAIGEMGELQLELLKAEVARDAGALARDLIPLALGVVPGTLGYCFGCVATVLLLESWFGTAAAWAMVAAPNLVLGGLAARVTSSRLKARAARAGFDRAVLLAAPGSTAKFDGPGTEALRVD